MSLQHQVFEVKSEKFAHYFLCNYRPASSGADGLSRSLLNFKNEKEEDVQAWIDSSLEELEKIYIKKGLMVLRALGSDEEETSSIRLTSLDVLGQRIAQQFGAVYLPHLLHKSRKTRRLKMLTATERATELDSVYYFSSPDSSQTNSGILLIDDILTTGATFMNVILSIRSKLAHSPIHLFTLACTDRQSLLNQSVRLKGSTYQWINSEGWLRVAEEGNFWNQKENLKSKIRDDSF